MHPFAWAILGGVCGWVWASAVIDARREPPLISDRQLAILEHVGRGLSTKEIAKREGLSEHTVNTHIRRARQSLGVTTRAAAATAVRRGARQPETPARPRRSATATREVTTSPTSSSKGT